MKNHYQHTECPKTVSLQTQVQKLQDRCRNLERVNGKLKNAGLSTADTDFAEQQAGRYEKSWPRTAIFQKRWSRCRRGTGYSTKTMGIIRISVKT